MIPERKLPENFFAGRTADVARRLLGKIIVHDTDTGTLAGKIVEVEAYLGSEDPASHAFRGMTRRNASMFAEGGTCYVYLCYGINYCMNVSTRAAGVGEAVLIRAIEPLAGIDVMAANRNIHSGSITRNISNGPGKLTQALAIGPEHDGIPLLSGRLRIVDAGFKVRNDQVGVSPRIGISKAADLPLRFFVKGSEWVSRTASVARS